MEKEYENTGNSELGSVSGYTLIYVETIYSGQYCREPDISEYKTEEEAQAFITTCLKWGIGIVNCEIINKEGV